MDPHRLNTPFRPSVHPYLHRGMNKLKIVIARLPHRDLVHTIPTTACGSAVSGPLDMPPSPPSPPGVFIDPQLGGYHLGPSIFPSTSHVLSCSTSVGLIDDVVWVAEPAPRIPRRRHKHPPASVDAREHRTVYVAHMRLGPPSCNRHVRALRRSSNWMTRPCATYTQTMADRTTRGPLADVVSPTCITLKPFRNSPTSISWM